ncbi:unnamed protein product, partial [Callosobruchus maculatus]
MGFYQDIQHRFGIYNVRVLKQWAKLNIRVASLKNRRIFLLTCRKERLIPNHIK